MRQNASAVVALVLTAGVAHARSPYHAVQQPLPELRSPSPSLPPPPHMLPPEPRNGLIPNGDGTYRWEGLTFVASVAGDGTISFIDRSPYAWDAVNGGVTFDLTDLVMRGRGEDPYRYEKHKVMMATFEGRARLRAHADRITMRAALDDLPMYLFAVWSEPRWAPELKRRILFELWDECAEDGSTLLSSGGAEARKTIEEFVRAHLPPGGPDAYRDAELAALNARRESRRGFTPYTP